VVSLKNHPWRLSYSTSAHIAGGKPIDILHDFYLPALQGSVRYDRVAGYFRSTSLAAASQGFSAFVANKGKARMVVGADLNLADVRAILAGAEERLAAALTSELEQAEPWPEAVVNGVELLAWMVARGFLEIRVAFRVHAATGEPLTLDSRTDGYVHEKWAVFSDETGARLYVAGSFNESRTALVRNAENIEVHRDWTGEENWQRADDAQARFERTWNNENPSLRVLTLPEAVRQRLLTLAGRTTRPREIDGSSAIPLEVPPPSTLERLRFALLRDGPKLPGGRYVGLATAPIQPWPHQTVVARRLIATWPYSYLLCDEVGLGKTIEAGLAIRSLYLSGLVKRVLISPPAGLARQWQRELAGKCLLPFGRALSGQPIRHEYLLPLEETRPAASLYAPDLAIVSTGLLSRQERRQELAQAAGFDLALIDEAHYARRSNPTGGDRAWPRYGQLYTTLQDILRPKARCLLLATATPMQLDAVEVADLVQLTDRVGAFQFDPALLNAYYAQPGKLVRAEPLDEPDWDFLRCAVQAIQRQDPQLWDFLQQVVIDPLSRLDVEQWLEHGLTPWGYGLEGVRRLIFAASPLSRVMLRHTRPLLEVYRNHGALNANLARRYIQPLRPVRFTDQEARTYQALEGYCRGLEQRLAGDGETRRRHALGFYLSFLRLRFASSLFAIRETLRRRWERVRAALQQLDREMLEETDELSLADVLDEAEDDDEAVQALLRDRTPADLRWEAERLQTLLAGLDDLSGPASKMQQLLGYLNERRLAGGRLQQTVIFTRFYDTLTDIIDRLHQVDARLLVGTYSGRGGAYFNPLTGRLQGTDREEVKHRFQRGEIDLLVCTDAAAEGLNLQTADLLINFDLPWNPMKVEQRIGRIDRIGQRHAAVHVVHLCYLNSAEEIVYGRLLQRLTQAGYVVGAQQLSLLPVTPEEFRRLAEGRLSEAELGRTAEQRAEFMRRRMASMEMPAAELYDIYQRLEAQRNEPLPVDMDAIWRVLADSPYLHDLGCILRPETEQRTLILNNVPGITDGAALTISRESYDAGIPDLGSRLRFATYGEPVFETLLSHLNRFELPPCLRRISVPAPDLGTELVGYAVACRNAGGQPEIRLATGVHELSDLCIDEDAVLSDAAVQPLRERLARLARREFDPIRAATGIEADNRQAGRSQLLLDYLMAHSLLHFRQQLGDTQGKFWPALDQLENLAAERRMIRVRPIPAKAARRLTGLLFEPILPTVGDEGYIDAPEVLLTTALAAAARIADSLHVAKHQLSINDMLGRLEREIEKLLRS